MNKINDNRFNTTDENNLASVYELISTYGMLASTAKYSILPNGRSLQVFRTSSNFLATFDTMADETLVPHIDSMILLTFWLHRATINTKNN
jgi:hypothetical protein